MEVAKNLAQQIQLFHFISLDQKLYFKYLDIAVPMVHLYHHTLSINLNTFYLYPMKPTYV